MTPAQIERFWSHVEQGPDCWEWTSARNSAGRGVVTIDGKALMAYRVAWTLSVGPIPEGLFVCHRCDHPWCVRPSHLFVGTQLDNQRDMCAKKRSHIPIGELNHEAKLTPEQVIEIRARYADGARRSFLARRYGVTYANVEAIVKRRSWKHLLQPLRQSR